MKFIKRLALSLSKFILLIVILNAGIEYLEELEEHKIISSTGATVGVVNTSGKKGKVATPNRRADNYMLGTFTAYNAQTNQTDADPYTMASTKKVYEGAIACPSKYEFGTKIYVAGLGEFTCEDRMNIRYDCWRAGNCKGDEKEHFDIFMWDYSEAIKFGRKEINFKVNIK